MARAHGARAQMALAFESVYGTAPAAGYRSVPFASTTLGSEQPLIASELLGQGRDPLTPIKDAVTADGDVVVPIDVENFGLWLKAAFGAPTTSATTPKTHTFQSGNWTLPSLSIETAMPEVPRYAMYTGCVCDQLSWQMARSGLLTATARLVAQGESVAAATAAGTPTSLALQRFGHFNGAITRNGLALGNVVSAEVTYANGLDRIETIRGDGRIDGADPGMAALGALQRLNLTAAELQALPLDQRIIAIQEALNQFVPETAMTKLAEIQSTILTTGAQRPDNIAQPLTKGQLVPSAKEGDDARVHRISSGLA